MPISRLLSAGLLLAACCVLPGSWASAAPQLSGQDKDKKSTKTTPEDTDKAVATLKKSVEKLQDDVTAANKSLADLKGVADKLDTLKKDIAAVQTGAAPKAAVGELEKQLAALQTELAAVKKAGESKDEAKALADRLAALEKSAEDGRKKAEDGIKDAATVGKQRGDTAWMLASSALVMFMVPGLALFYGGMVRRKNVLSTMMHSMAAVAVVGVFWVTIGYSLAFGRSVVKIDLFGAKDGGLFGWSWDLVLLKGIEPSANLGGYDIPVYVHVMFQGMFAIITPALISGAIAERIRFWPFCLFMLLWVTFVYCPLAHMVWAFDWFDPAVLAAKRGGSPIGLLGKMGALDFAGGTVVHIAAGVAGLACCLVIGKRAGYPRQIAHPNSMVLTLLGAGLLWFGWFGFNGGSSVRGDNLAGSAFAATQAAAAAAGLAWLLVEWVHKGKPTALGLASGIVAGLVAVTPASGFVYVWGAVLIGVAASALCYLAVTLKNVLGYDDSLDAFGVHGVGGFVGAVLTGVFCSLTVNPAGGDGPFAYQAHRARLEALKANDGQLIKAAETALADADTALAEAEKGVKGAADDQKSAAEKARDAAKELRDDKAATHDALKKELETIQSFADKQDDKENDGKDKKSALSQVFIQLKAAVFSGVFAFALSLGLVFLTQAVTLGNFKTDPASEAEGLDRTEHGEVGFDFSGATESVTVRSAEPRPASVPKGNGRFEVELAGAEAKELMAVWSELCKPSDQPADKDFLAVYPHVTTVRGTTFRCRGGDPGEM
ncbi:MAG: ammonium transporter, partial [Gemmataceae bacterium]|nr:ammonium transporter [Gemmataceae bacterium]